MKITDKREKKKNKGRKELRSDASYSKSMKAR